MPRKLRTLDRAFGKALTSLRQGTGLSQEKFAATVGLHRTYISQLERGLKSPTLDTIGAIAAALKTRPHQLVKAAEDHLRRSRGVAHWSHEQITRTPARP